MPYADGRVTVENWWGFSAQKHPDPAFLCEAGSGLHKLPLATRRVPTCCRALDFASGSHPGTSEKFPEDGERRAGVVPGGLLEPPSLAPIREIPGQWLMNHGQAFTTQVRGRIGFKSRPAGEIPTVV